MKCTAELIYPSGLIDRCDRESHPSHNWHSKTHSEGQWASWVGALGRERAWEDLQWQVRKTWKLAGRNDPPPLYEYGPKYA